MHAAARTSGTHRPVIIVIAAILAAYLVATLAGLTSSAAGTEHGGSAPAVEEVAHLWAVIPFTLLLAAIAVLPLLEQTAHWWESNLNKFYVAANLALVTVLYLGFLHPAGSIGLAGRTVAHVVAQDYIPFIVLLFSLYTISGGIRIEGDLPAHALTNCLFLASGALLASFIGTTGAAMLLIRPLLETNSERKHVAHTVVFFIFVVCNCGGMLLPLGDPPLFLGYLNGVSFLWTLSLWKSWLFVNGSLLAVYFAVDHFFYYPREKQQDIAADERQIRRLSFFGLWPNGALLAGIVLSVALLDPGQPFPGTSWHPWIYLREMTQLALVAVSLLRGPVAVREANDFNYVAIVEVGALFLGIFVAMQPALEILNARGASLGIDTPREFFWASGWLSSVLDNAPTYLVFFQTAQSLSTDVTHRVAGVAEPLLTGISLGAVTMGAMTYIGNGPNFMVKTIAEQSSVRMPSFFGYMIYSFLVLLPILAMNTLLFIE
jgi:Na+/H+ antiporter NhaD/arsenite permease-like protein